MKKRLKGLPKKVVSLILVCTMIVSLCGCGKKKEEFEISKKAYDNICSAFKLTAEYGEDIYESWRIGIQEGDDMSLEVLSKELHLSEDEVYEGIVKVLCDKTDSDREKIESAADNDKDLLCKAFFGMVGNDEAEMFNYCILVVRNSYEQNGRIDEIQSYLDDAKSQMKSLSDKYSDYEYYPDIKGFYTTTSAYFDFCKEPTGSFKQLVDTTKDYEKEARDYKNNLDFIFEDEDSAKDEESSEEESTEE